MQRGIWGSSAAAVRDIVGFAKERAGRELYKPCEKKRKQKNMGEGGEYD